MKKTNIRSIRFSDELADLIERQQGNTFTEKFENLITRCVWELPKREAQLEQLDKAIIQKREQLQKLQSQISSLNYTAQEISTQLKVLGNVINNKMKRWETEE